MHKQSPVWALAGVAQFLRQPRDLRTLELLIVAEIGGMLRPEIVEGRAIRFYVEDGRGTQIAYQIDPSTFALLLLIVLAGQSVFVNYTGDRPILKAFGKLDNSAGVTVARIAAGREAGEEVRFRDGDATNLTFENLGDRGSKAKRGEVDWLQEALFAATTLPDELFSGEPAEKFAFMRGLFDAARDCMAEERDEAA